MGFPTQEYWSGLPFPSLFPTQVWFLPALQADSLPLSHQGSLIIRIDILMIGGFPSGSRVKNRPTMQETQETSVPLMGGEDPLKKEMATHSSIFARKISWTEKPGGLQSTGSQRIGHDWARTHIYYKDWTEFIYLCLIQWIHVLNCILREITSRTIISTILLNVLITCCCC